MVLLEGASFVYLNVREHSLPLNLLVDVCFGRFGSSDSSSSGFGA
jgi:hypothetical protein